MIANTATWGDLVCDYYTVETEYFTNLYMFGVYDGVVHVFGTGDGEPTAIYGLVGSSTVF